jgi:hypothetical protein
MSRQAVWGEHFRGGILSLCFFILPSLEQTSSHGRYVGVMVFQRFGA